MPQADVGSGRPSTLNARRKCSSACSCCPRREQRLADLPRQHGLLDRFTAVAESPLVGGYHLAVAPASASASPAMAPAWSAALKRYAWAFSHSSARAK